MKKSIKVTITSKQQTTSYEVTETVCLIGRSPNSQIQFDHDLISKNHLKIMLVNDNILLEEMGSTNGSFLNGKQLKKGIIVNYENTDELIIGGKSGAKVEIVKLLDEKSEEVVVDQEKTLIFTPKHQQHSQIQMAEKKVANGSSGPMALHKENYQKNYQETPPLPNHNLDNQLKEIIQVESKRLKEKAIQEIHHIKKAALDEKDEILQGAAKHAEEIVLKSNEKIAKTEQDFIDKTNKQKEEIKKSEEKIAKLKSVLLSYEQKLQEIQKENDEQAEKLKDEKIALEEMRHQFNNVSKNVDAKLEDVANEERRARSKIETEYYEAQSKVAKTFAEAERAQQNKAALDLEIIDLKKIKSTCELEINEIEITKRKTEYELEKKQQAYHDLLANIDEAEQSLSTLTSIADEEKQKLADEYQRLESEKNLAAELLQEAKEKSESIVLEAQKQAMLERKNIAKSLLEHENQKKEILDQALEEKKAMLVAGTNEALALQHKKVQLLDEMKWLQESAQKKAEMIIQEGKKAAQTFMESAQKTSQELQSQKMQELEKNKNDSLKAIQKEKEKMLADSEAVKLRDLEEIKKIKNNLAQEKNRIDSEHHKIEELKKTLQLAIERTDGLMNDNHLEADREIKEMLAEAQIKKKEIEKQATFIKVQAEEEIREAKAKQLLEIEKIAKAQKEKINEHKRLAEEEFFNKNIQNADAIAALAQEHLTAELLGYKDFIMDERSIRKFSDVSRRIFNKALLGNLTPSKRSLESLYAKKRINFRQLFRSFFKISIMAGAFGGIGFIIYSHPKESLEMLKMVLGLFKMAFDYLSQIDVHQYLSKN